MSEGSSGEEEDGPDVLLGFLEEPEKPQFLQRHFFPSKVGGLPAWLNPKDLPSSEALKCPFGNGDMKFLLQVYSPQSGNDAAFHRTMYVFVSREGHRLAEPGGVRVFRCQMPRKNEFYPFEPPGNDAEVPSGEAAVADGDAQAFPLFELVVELEPDDAKSEGEQHASEGDGTVAADLEDDDEEEDDKVLEVGDDVFATFRERVKRAPQQCLRYCFEEGAQPLWLSARGMPDTSSVPCCSNCGAPRFFEFQVMPQLLHFLKSDPNDPHSLEFGCIAVYSCSKSCVVDGYVEETVFVQPSL